MYGWLTVEAVATATGLSVQVVRVACRRGQLAGRQGARRQWVVQAGAVDAWLAARAERTDEYGRLRRSCGSEVVTIGQMAWEVRERETRRGLLRAAYRGTPEEAWAALAKLRERPYRLTLPLVERRLRAAGEAERVPGR